MDLLRRRAEDLQLGDKVGDLIVFNVNSYRVIATVRYQIRKVFVAHVFTHSEYEKWKP